MSDPTVNQKSFGLFLVWKKYQRRAEVMAPLINCKLKFIPHLFKNKYLRPLDYLIKLIVSVKDIWLRKPKFVVAQCPPTFSALPPWLAKTPYVIDAHNPLFQVAMWQNLPLSKSILHNALGIIVHNAEMFQLVKKNYPSAQLFTICDPLESIQPAQAQKRHPKQILVIASFDPWDEPVDLLIETMAALADFDFIITADPDKLALETAAKLRLLKNVKLTGFLATAEYHQMLCSSLAALVLTTSDATQPSGACEALSSNTQLIISKTSLTQKLFGEWAVLVENSSESIIQAIENLSLQELDLAPYRERWNASVHQEISRLIKLTD
ncbi:MAG: glycosyltransferase [Pleurocapsa sp.]